MKLVGVRLKTNLQKKVVILHSAVGWCPEKLLYVYCGWKRFVCAEVGIGQVCGRVIHWELLNRKIITDLEKSFIWKCLKSERVIGENTIYACSVLSFLCVLAAGHFHILHFGLSTLLVQTSTAILMADTKITIVFYLKLNSASFWMKMKDLQDFFPVFLWFSFKIAAFWNVEKVLPYAFEC